MSKLNKKSSSKKVVKSNEEESPQLNNNESNIEVNVEPKNEVNVEPKGEVNSEPKSKNIVTKKKSKVPNENNKSFNFNNGNVNLNSVENANLYVNTIIHKRIIVSFTNVGNNMNDYFKNFSERNFEGKCHKEGFIKQFSTQIINYSTGHLKGDMVIYDVVISADICFPYEGMEIMCKIKNITKIGIRGVVSDNHNPIILFISREHNATKDFDNYEEGQYIKIKVIGHRFEMNDEYISVIGEII